MVLSMFQRTRSGVAALVTLLVAAATLLLASPAHADPVLKAGPSGETSGGFCPPSLITPSYSQQASGVEPKVGDVFYLSLRVDLSLVTFDCANEFYSVLADLPPNVQTAVSGSATTICRRWGNNANGQQVNDQRAQANCQANPSVNGNGEFSMRPIASPSLPDVGGAAGSYWFAGLRSPQESQSFTSVQLLVPIKATATMTNQPISFLVCGTGSNCVTVSVPLTVTSGPADADPPRVSLPANTQTTAVGARVPFTINDRPTGSSYFLRVDTATIAGFTGGRICGAAAPTYFALSAGPPPVPYSGSISSEIQWGDLQTGGITCYLAPNTTYYVEVCAANPSTAFPWTPFAGCRTTQFKTGAVNVSLALPTQPPFPVAPSAAVRVLGGHPAGTVKVQAKRWADADGAYADVSTATAVTQSVSDAPVSNQPVSGLNQWRSYKLRACFIAGAHQPCSTAIEYTTGHATTGASTQVTHEAATLSGTPSAPNPALGMVILTSPTDPGTADPRQVMSAAGSTSIPANATATPNLPSSVRVTGLQPQTTYFWTACFNNSAALPSLEDCGEVKTFTTAAAPTFCDLNPAAPACTPDPCDDTPKPASCNPLPPADAVPPSGQAPPSNQTPGSGQTPPTTTSLSVGAVKPLAVRRGARGKLRVPVSNTSPQAAAGVRICPSLPARFKGRLTVPACRSVGSLAAGGTSTALLTVKAPKATRPGAVTVKLTLTWNGGSSKGSARVTVRR